MRSISREPAVVIVLVILVSLMLMFIVYPQVQVVIVPGLGGYFDFLGGQTWIKPLFNSIQIMLFSTTTAVTLGFIYAYSMVYSEMPWKPFFRMVGILPLLSPPFVVAASYILLFGPRGVITYGIFGQSPLILGFYGLWGVQTIAFFPFAYQLIADVLARNDPRLEQAARNLGASTWNVFRTITLPLARPGLAVAILTTAIYILEDFGNPLLIAGQFTVLPSKAYSLIEGFGDFPGAAAVSTILLVLALVLYVAKLRIEGNRSYVTISGKATSIPRPPVPRSLTAACFIACLALAGLIFMVYGVLIVSALTVSFPNNLGFTLNHFEYLGSHSQSLVNSLKFGGIAAVICALFAMLLAFLVQRKEWWGRQAVDFMAIMPAAVPGLFFGIGYATAFNQRIFDWIDRGTLITISMIFWNIPVGYQAAIAGLQQIDRSLDEAATSLGASTLRVFRDILFPLLDSALLTGFVTAFVRAVTTLSVVIFLFTPGTTVATITIFQLVTDFDWGGSTAFTVSVIGTAVIVLSGVYLISGRRAGLQRTAGG
ncbi:MAG: iron ABC transporter permease [Chloroflexota bacterium]|nr:iron ABC transporter permease [Chloroflexota bacterium]